MWLYLYSLCYHHHRLSQKPEPGLWHPAAKTHSTSDVAHSTHTAHHLCYMSILCNRVSTLIINMCLHILCSRVRCGWLVVSRCPCPWLTFDVDYQNSSGSYCHFHKGTLCCADNNYIFSFHWYTFNNQVCRGLGWEAEGSWFKPRKVCW